MKLKDNIDVVGFLKTVKTCEKEVYYCSKEGDRLDLKSELSQYVLSVNSSSGLLREGTILCDDERDYRALKEFLKA